MTLAKRLKEVRQSKRIRQEDLAEAVGASVKTIQRWESGASLPNAKKIQELAGVLGLSACCSNQIDEGEILRYAIIPRDWLDGPEGDKTPYIFYIQRDSMDPLIKSGEGLLINPNMEVTHGRIAICCWNGYVMIRGVIYEGDNIRLLAKNPTYEDVVIPAKDAPNVLKFGGVVTTCIGRARHIEGFF